MMRRSIQPCPKCGEPVRPKDILPAGPFPCPACGTQLQAAETYPQFSFYGSILLDVLVFVALGFRGLRLLLGVLLTFVPVLYLQVNLLKYLIPPRIEVYLPKDSTLRLREGPRL